MGSRSFAVENLESRTLFSVVAAAPHSAPQTLTPAVHAVAHAAKKHKRPHPLGITFNVAGDYTRNVRPGPNPDVAVPYVVSGTGKTKSLGAFTLTGHLQPPGFIQNGQTHGKLTIRTAKGSIVLSVVGPPQDSGVFPPSLTFKILKGHGAYRRSKGTGHIVIAASDTTQKFVFRFNPPA